MWLIKVFGVIYLTAACAAQDVQDVQDVTATFDSSTSPMPRSTVIPTVYEPPVPSLTLQSTWLDVFPSEKVEFSCSITGSSDWTFIWSRDGEEVQDSDPNVSLSAEGSVLRITAATQAYSGSYSCKCNHKARGVTTKASNSKELKVYVNKPKPTVSRSSNFDQMYPGESITFTCTIDMFSGWEYLWYHDGKEIQASNSNTYTIASIGHPNRGEYLCKAQRGKGPFTEESKTTTLQVSDPPKPSLRLLSPWMDVFESEIVEFGCDVNSSDWTFTWYKNNVRLQEDDVVTLDAEEPYLNLTSITQAYQGGYACKVHLESRNVNSGFSNTVNVSVYENLPKPTLSKDPGFNPMYVGETASFTCNVDVSSGWEYMWYKDGKYFPESSKTISIHLDPSKGGKYKCKANRGETVTDSSEEMSQGVLDIPVPSLKLTTPWLDVFPAESVKLGCRMDGSPDWKYTWYKDGQSFQADSSVSFDSNGANLSINTASTAHAGQYKCKGHLNDRSVNSTFSSGLNLTVYDKKPSIILTQDPEYKLMFPGESVSFSCHIYNSSGWEYLWSKDGSRLGGAGNKYTISTVGTEKRGSYECQAQRGTNPAYSIYSTHVINLQVEEKKPKPLMTQHPDFDKVYIGESVSFECKVELSSGWEYLWYKDGVQLSISSSRFVISDPDLLDSGTYECMAIRKKTKYNTERSDERTLRISEIPVPLLKVTTPWLDVFPTESVKLSCGVDGSSDWRYTWYKDGQKVQADNSVSFDSDGATLSIGSASTFHRGQYNCSGRHKSRSVSSSFSPRLTLDVYDTKPKVILMQNPTHNEMHTGDSVSFSCHINVSAGWEYLWYKDGSPIGESEKDHSITSVLTKNTGSYKCQTKRGRDTVLYSDQSEVVRLTVEERPQADIVLLTGWSEVFSTDSLVLKCGVQGSQDVWNYTWFKEDQPIQLLLSEKYTVTPQNDPDQSLYTCQGVRTGRPSYSKHSNHFKTKNLLLKRRVLLSISGCIFFGIIAVFIGCIVLRVIRKPAEDEYKPEEAELFLSMAQLKDRDDAHCPMVQYITDAELNSSAKAGEENGTVSSEATPLPISSQEEEQALTTESNDATENNGGMVSFKQ